MNIEEINNQIKELEISNKEYEKIRLKKRKQKLLKEKRKERTRKIKLGFFLSLIGIINIQALQTYKKGNIFHSNKLAIESTQMDNIKSKIENELNIKIEEDKIEIAKEIMKKAEEKNVNLILPVDTLAADDMNENANTMILLSRPFSKSEPTSEQFNFQVKFFDSQYLLDYFVSNNPLGRSKNTPLMINMNKCTEPYYVVLNYNQKYKFHYQLCL